MIYDYLTFRLAAHFFASSPPPTGGVRGGHPHRTLIVSFAGRLVHPVGDALLHAPLEGGAEGAVAVVAALQGQFLGGDGLLCSGKLAVAGYEVTDAKVVDVFIVACVLVGEILAEIIAVLYSVIWLNIFR